MQREVLHRGLILMALPFNVNASYNWIYLLLFRAIDFTSENPRHAEILVLLIFILLNIYILVMLMEPS